MSGKRYSKRVREEAALICAIAASNQDMSCGYGAVYDALGLTRPWRGLRAAAFDLAINAWGKCCPAYCNIRNWQAHDAEAESLIRTGWSPSNG